MRICLLVIGPVADDPRVRRQGDALAAAGHQVSAIGLDGATSPPPTWAIETVARRRGGVGLGLLGARLLAVRAVPPLAVRAYWSLPEHRRMLEKAVATGADVVHANDWDTLPVAIAAAAELLGAAVVYDSHELATEESDRPLWRMLFPAYIRRLEGGAIRQVAAVTTVADGIADVLAAQYDLDSRPTVIRNTPPFQKVEYREPGEHLTVLYQGLLNPDKGIDRLIHSVSFWRSEFRLVLRGYGAPRYEAHLRKLAAGNDRIEFSPRVPMTEMVSAASTADIGIHPLPAVNRQTRYALPNKLFEYAMAGLALCVSGAPEMKRVVEWHGLGVTFPNAEPVTIAAAVNGMTREAVARYKRNSLAAARQLSWDTEQAKLLDIYAGLAGRP